MKEKLIKIIIPYIIISTGFLLIYSLLYWLIFIQLKLIDINESIVFFFVPLGISTILVWFYFRKKLRLIETTVKFRDFTLIITCFLLTGPIWTFQFYLDTRTEELTNLKSVDEISTNKLTKYYSIDSSFQHKDRSGLFVLKTPVNKGKEIGVFCNFTCPISNTSEDLNNNNIWISVVFNEAFSDRVFDNEEKQTQLISNFIDSSIVLYEKHIHKTTYLKRISNSDEASHYLKAIQQTNLPYDNEKLIILKEEKGSFESRAGTSLWWTKFSIITSNLYWILLTIFTKLINAKKKNTL